MTPGKLGEWRWLTGAISQRIRITVGPTLSIHGLQGAEGLRQDLAPVNHQILAGHVTRLVGGEKQGAIGDVQRLPCLLVPRKAEQRLMKSGNLHNRHPGGELQADEGLRVI